MRKLLLTACVGLIACVCSAAPRAYTLKMVLGAATGATNTLTGLSGYIDEIHVSVSDGVSTGTVALAYMPLDGITPAVNIATGVVTAAKVWRPRIDVMDIAGADLTNDPPARVMLAGESVRMIVTGSPTNKTWTATIKLDR